MLIILTEDQLQALLFEAIGTFVRRRDRDGETEDMAQIHATVEVLEDFAGHKPEPPA